MNDLGDPCGRADDPVLFRRAMSQFMSGVTIVATRDRLGVCHGMTATSFTSVSLDPPLVSVCIARDAASFAAFSACPGFGVSILSGEQVDIALRFAQRSDDKFEGLPFEEYLDSAPVLAGSASTVSCTVFHRLPAGDHLILVGRARSCHFGAARSLLAHGDGRFVEIMTGNGEDTAPNSSLFRKARMLLRLTEAST